MEKTFSPEVDKFKSKWLWTLSSTQYQQGRRQSIHSHMCLSTLLSIYLVSYTGNWFILDLDYSFILTSQIFCIFFSALVTVWYVSNINLAAKKIECLWCSYIQDYSFSKWTWEAREIFVVPHPTKKDFVPQKPCIPRSAYIIHFYWNSIFYYFLQYKCQNAKTKKSQSH